MSIARYLSKFAALLGSDGKVPATGLATGASASNLGFNPMVGDGVYTSDLNNCITSGAYRIQPSATNLPTGANPYGQLFVSRGAFSDTITQIYGDYANGALYTRSGNPPSVNGSGTWSSWHAVTGLGTAGQSWSDLTGSRANNTTYTNTTGRPIAINIAKSANGAGNLYVNGSNMGYYYANSNDFSLFAIVPAGATYQAAFSGIARWSELR